ncbi:hypothetical protein G9A89_003020 [Geosiphon pyriformis]|nr:hypothetical protein G9A89_003020 [Geosiphon pyriformis]
MELAIPLISPAVQIIRDNLKINSVTGGSTTSRKPLLAQAQTPNSPLNRFARPEDFTLLRGPTRQQEPLQTSSNLLDFLAENQSEHSETAANKENNSEITEEESIDKWLNQVTKAGDANGWNAARMLRTIPYFLKGTAGKWFENLATPFNNWNAFKAAFLEQFTNNNTSITLHNFCPHAPEDLNSAIQHAKRYEMAMEEANRTKLVNLAIGETSSAAEEKIDQLTKKQPQRYQPPQKRNQNNFAPLSNNQPQNCHYYQQNRSNQPCPTANPTAIPTTTHTTLSTNNNRISSNNQLVPRNITQPRPNHYHTQPSYLTMPEEQNFHHTALLEGRAAAQQQNPSYTSTTIPSARIAKNANLSDIFLFEFEANKSPFLLSNAAANEQKAITAMYTEAKVKRKTIRLILNNRSTGSIITYQLMQQLKRNTPIGKIDNFPFTLDEITIPVKVLVMDTPQYQAFIGNDWLQKANANLNWETQELTISYQGQHARISAICGTFNKCSEKAPAFEFEPEEENPLIETFMALESTSNWADETEQEHFTPHSESETSGWNIPYSKPEPKKQRPYIPLKCKDCHKKLSSMGACISPKEEYENHTCYYCKTCHRERWGHLIKRSGKCDNTSCLTCGDMLPEECNWIDVAMKEGVCDQTCQYALSISEKVKRGTPFNAAYNSALNKLYHYPHDAEMIFDLAMALINGATKKDVCQMKETEYIEYTMELAGFNYEDKVEVYHQIASHTYPTQETQIQRLEQMNIRLCEECIMPSFPCPAKMMNTKLNSENLKQQKKLRQHPSISSKIRIKPEKAHKINARYDLRYSGKDILTLKPKFLTKINFKIAFEIPPGAMVQIAS